jgi:glycosyltransferase involved in cell wall biosynthesis
VDSSGAGLAIVNEQALDLGGAERVVDALVERYPRARVVAPRFEPRCCPPGYRPPHMERTTALGPVMPKRPFRAPLYARRLRAADLRGARVVVSVTQNGWSLAAPVPPGARHLCYSSGPSGALYLEPRVHRAREPARLRPLLWGALPALRAYDRHLMRRPDTAIANSTYSARELERVHGRPFTVVHPPVKTGFFTPGAGPREHYLVVARLERHKRVSAAVEAFHDLDAKLVVAGGGRELERLRSLAGPNVEFTGPVEDERLRELYRRSRGVLQPGLETFGIAMVEAQACGTPVIALRAGGALEVVRHGSSGLLLERTDPASLADAVRALEREPLDPADCRASAARFGVNAFVDGFERVLTAA